MPQQQTQQREKSWTYGENLNKPEGALPHLSLGVPTLCVCGSVGPPCSWWHSCVSRLTRKTRSQPHSLQNRPPRRPLLWGEARLHSVSRAHLPLRETDWDTKKFKYRHQLYRLKTIWGEANYTLCILTWSCRNQIQHCVNGTQRSNPNPGKGCMKSQVHKRRESIDITTHLGWSA